MDYQLPKALPATGAGLAAFGLTGQIGLMLGIFVSVFLIATAIRVYFRRHKNLSDI
jgi:hypothetical protein